MTKGKRTTEYTVVVLTVPLANVFPLPTSSALSMGSLTEILNRTQRFGQKFVYSSFGAESWSILWRFGWTLLLTALVIGLTANFCNLFQIYHPLLLKAKPYDNVLTSVCVCVYVCICYPVRPFIPTHTTLWGPTASYEAQSPLSGPTEKQFIQNWK